jgi:hypothetical protein
MNISKVNSMIHQTSFGPNCNSTKVFSITPPNIIVNPSAKKFAINLLTVINLNYSDVATSSSHSKHLKNYTNANNHLNRVKMKAESFIDVKIGDYKITVKSMNDLKNGYWLNDEVRN